MAEKFSFRKGSVCHDPPPPAARKINAGWPCSQCAGPKASAARNADEHYSALQSRKLYQCRHRFQVSLTQGAILDSIKLLLPIWMLAISLVIQPTARVASSFSLCAVP